MDRPISTRPALSAIICAYDRADLLNLTLESLCRQTLPRDQFEVVVVDDGSKDGTRDVVRAFEPRLPLRYSYQRNAGLASARNHGIFVARGDILLFFEDDVAEPRLLERHLEAHRKDPDPRHGVLGCMELDPQMASDPLMHFMTEIGGFSLSSRPKAGERLGFDHFSAGRSSCKRSFLLDHGVFNPALGFGCEDVELAFRLSKNGFRVVYEPRAVSVVVEKASVDEVCGRLHQLGRSIMVLSTLHPDAPVQRWAGVARAGEAWREAARVYEGMIRSARELDRIVRTRREAGLPVRPLDLALLHRSYWAAFRASKVKGMVEKAREMGYDLAVPAFARSASHGQRGV